MSCESDTYFQQSKQQIKKAEDKIPQEQAQSKDSYTTTSM